MHDSHTEEREPLPPLARSAHLMHVKRALAQLPGQQVSLDSSRMSIIFYCIGTMDLLGVLHQETTEMDRASWRSWVWEQYTGGSFGAGFRPGPFMSTNSPTPLLAPHIIMTYTALLCLALLRDDFTRLSRSGLAHFVKSCQKADGSFSAMPFGVGDCDLRNLYCAFGICALLKSWSSINVERAVAYIASCRTYEGGYGQTPGAEAHGGTTYLAIAALQMVTHSSRPRLSPSEKDRTIYWLVHNQDASGGFRGRTGKMPDACYCFWGGGALQILGEQDKVDAYAFVNFISACQFSYGGIAKAPGQYPDPYHTYLALAAAAMYTPLLSTSALAYGHNGWNVLAVGPFNPLFNAREEVVQWARQHIPCRL
ncbi:unnamed protein product [Mycena citricolor]|uniref:Prenyltransferase alpha-alpha toroid domain-containing protein n=1 Tax=Mycena citricolor TaxID=2018698 RepID=A0AAD2HUG6_9AGAR|nr:unnamed protein product [Mycena citricolor]